MTVSSSASPRSRRRLLVSLLAIVALLVPASAVAAPPASQFTTIQILNISDWHGQLDPQNFGGPDIGGAAVLSAYFDLHRAANPNTLTVTGGDDIGASPPLSSFFDEEPAVLAQRLMGIDVGTFGNHNFDKGIDHLQDMIDLAADPGEVGDPYRYVSANLQNRDAELTGVEDFAIFEIDGVRVAVIGITNPEAPTLVFPGNFGTIVPTDPVEAAKRALKAARHAGATVFVAITHLGITGTDTAGNPSGPLTDFAEQVPGFDVIFGDHTDVQFSARIRGALVVENRSKGVTYAATELTVNRTSGRVAKSSNEFHSPVAPAVTPDPQIISLLQPYRDLLRPILEVFLGNSTVAIPRGDACGTGNGRTCESKIGNVITDAMRLRYAADFAITNAGGIRANLTCPVGDSATDFCASSLYPFPPATFPITRGQTFGVLPFGNFTVTATISGAELKAMLENGVSRMPAIDGRFPQVSGLCFTYDVHAPAGSRVTGAVRQAANGSCTATAVDLTAAASYLVAMNDFMGVGGDGYLNLATRIASDGTTLEQTLADHITANAPITPTIQGRIVCTTSGATACPVVTP